MLLLCLLIVMQHKNDNLSHRRRMPSMFGKGYGRTGRYNLYHIIDTSKHVGWLLPSSCRMLQNTQATTTAGRRKCYKKDMWGLRKSISINTLGCNMYDSSPLTFQVYPLGRRPDSVSTVKYTADNRKYK